MTRNQILISTTSDNQQAFFRSSLPDGDFRKIVIKPNWVKHEEHPQFPITALVTDTSLLRDCILAVIEKYPMVESIIVGDVPLQTCDWDQLVRQAGLRKLQDHTEKMKQVVRVLDLRRERWIRKDGFMELENDIAGDPEGYAEVILDEKSLLEEVSHRSDSFRVSDYDPKETVSKHRKGFHRYLIARSILNADLVINFPKMKTHQKSGITGALKNLVGINGSKAYLVHHQEGRPSQGGDEFPDSTPGELILQVRLREILQKRSRRLFGIFKFFWEVLKKIRGIKTIGTKENLNSSRFYMGAGSWYGNDSIWRMVYDLNLILLFAGAEGGPLKDLPQRNVVHFLDGIIAGEGNGPLQPLPVKTGILASSQNPFLIDFAISKLMGFDWRKIKLLANYKRFYSRELNSFEPDGFDVELDGKVSSQGLKAIPTIHRFTPPPGWRGHIEQI